MTIASISFFEVNGPEVSENRRKVLDKPYHKVALAVTVTLNNFDW